ncbi:ZIP family metal transporter [Aquimarina agarilytica]|uniref:ZIP family metal transporter n=1 Tax=Aquimarina agarilytica TaxID=1087449 RepID=UPI000288EE1F|nr:ZIP family metal transporter [Aquimarina agarilytica]
MNYLLPVIAVLLGFGLVYFLKPENQRNIKILLSFSGGFLLAITVFNLIPEIFEHSHNQASKYIGLFILFGILFQIFLEYFSKGAEHGHTHSHGDQKEFPWLLFFSLSIHAFLEGFPIHKTHGLLIGIIIHKIPVAIILATFLVRSELSKIYTFVFMLLFAFATPLGSFIADNFSVITQFYTEITAVVVGIFLHISTTILFESSEGHRFNLAKLAAIISAITLAYFI